METSILAGLAITLTVAGFAMFGVAMRYLWVSEFYVPPKRKRRSRAGINLKDK